MSKDRLEVLAERVQELEGSEKEWVSFQVAVNNIIFNLEEQNERYRKALIKVKLGSESDVPHCSTRLKSINKVVVKTLEGESE